MQIEKEEKKTQNAFELATTFILTLNTHKLESPSQTYQTSLEHNHLRFDKISLMMCGQAYCKQTLLIRFFFFTKLF